MLLRAVDGAGFSHQALLYSSLEEFLDAAVPFVRDGARRGDVTLVVCVPGNLAALRRELSEPEAAEVVFEPSTERLTHPARALARHREVLTHHVSAGRRVRLIGEPPLEHLPEAQLRDIPLMDAAFEAVCRLPGVSAVCPYDLRSSPSALVDDVRRIHAEVVERGTRRASDRYTHPARLFIERRTGRPLPEPRGTVAELTSPHDPSAVRSFVRTQASRAGMAGPELDDFLFAVHEIAANAFAHAAIRDVRVWRDGRELICEVRDDGPGLDDPLAGYTQAGEDRTGGRGIWLAHQLADLVDVRTGGTGSVVRLRVRMPS